MMESQTRSSIYMTSRWAVPGYTSTLSHVQVYATISAVGSSSPLRLVEAFRVVAHEYHLAALAVSQ